MCYREQPHAKEMQGSWHRENFPFLLKLSAFIHGLISFRFLQSPGTPGHMIETVVQFFLLKMVNWVKFRNNHSWKKYDFVSCLLPFQRKNTFLVSLVTKIICANYNKPINGEACGYEVHSHSFTLLQSGSPRQPTLTSRLVCFHTVSWARLI